jgi:hypothetical protein
MGADEWAGIDALMTKSSAVAIDHCPRGRRVEVARMARAHGVTEDDGPRVTLWARLFDSHRGWTGGVSLWLI